MLEEGGRQETLQSESDSDIPELYPTKIGLKAGFTLTDPQDIRYQALKAHREKFGSLVHEAATTLGVNAGDEDHIDAVTLVLKVLRSVLTQTLKAVSLLTSGYQRVYA